MTTHLHSALALSCLIVGCTAHKLFRSTCFTHGPSMLPTSLTLRYNSIFHMLVRVHIEAIWITIEFAETPNVKRVA